VSAADPVHDDCHWSRDHLRDHGPFDDHLRGEHCDSQQVEQCHVKNEAHETDRPETGELRLESGDQTSTYETGLLDVGQNGYEGFIRSLEEHPCPSSAS
jgi:hypothetical protein